MNNEIRELLEEIQDWMMENDYESGDVGSDIYAKISELLNREEQ